MNYETGRPTNADASSVTTRNEFATFASSLYDDFNGSGRAEWTNKTLDDFLDGLAAFADARITNTERDQETASWTLFAEIIAAATGYE